MTQTFAQSALQAAALRIEGVVSAAAERLAETLALAAPPFGSSRQDITLLQGDLQRCLPAFNHDFAAALRERMSDDAAQHSDARRTMPATTNWEALSLVGDAEVDARVNTDRLSMELAHECEWELRELDGYVGALLQSGRRAPEHNPLRTEVVARALLTAIQTVSTEASPRKILAREFGRVLAPAMRACYAAIVADLREQGVRTTGLEMRAMQGPGYDLPPRDSAGHSSRGTDPGPAQGSDNRELRGDARSVRSQQSGSGVAPGPSRGRQEDGAVDGDVPQRHGSDAQMLEMLRRLAFASGGAPDSAFPLSGAPTGASDPGASGMPDAAGVHSVSGGASGAASHAGAISGLMHVNLIRQHREELVRASGGALDHMVIDVVSAMFDHLLSDSKVPPQLARQIARLQMPVLRAALKDMGFFSSRRHPVRRFVNRIASLAAAYEDLDQGPGRDFIERVRSLVQEIVEGDFDQMDLYESKLQTLESLIQEQSRRDVGSHAQAAALLDGRETQLRIQQRYMLQLRSHLEPLELPDYLRDFLSQVWSQVQVQVSSATGTKELVQRMNGAAQELVLSIQPKGEPQLRKGFLLKLPQLMKDLNDGLTLIRWPEPARKEFFARLLPAHANSLKAPPLTDFEQRQLKFKLEQMAKVVIPTEQDLGSSAPTPLPAAEQHAAPLQFSAQEVEQTGLIEESAVDWNGEVDIDLGESDANPSTGSSAVDIELEAEAQDEQRAEGAPPTHGPQLIHHVQTGIAYRMLLEGRWQRVRLSWVSPQRAFFVFTHGKAHEKTLSTTARMLTRMCETERFRSFEQAELIERATARARKQLAQLTAASRLGSLGSRHGGLGSRQ
ncbi:MAG: DUF1631 family protein [Methylibium sp.]|nr:DUF1631 family protein [Methylibium sp.]